MNAIVSNNMASGALALGGGILNDGTAVTITNTTITTNTAALEGGGIWNNTGTVTIDTNSIINANVAQGTAADNGGGAIYNSAGTVNVTGGSITNNTALGTSGSGPASTLPVTRLSLCSVIAVLTVWAKSFNSLTNCFFGFSKLAT